MLNTKSYILTANFSFDGKHLEQILLQMQSDSGFNWLEFDLDICGYYDGTTYFTINRITFDSIDSLMMGIATIELETNLDITALRPGGIPVVCDIAKYIKYNNSDIFLINTKSEFDIIRVSFTDLYIR